MKSSDIEQADRRKLVGSTTTQTFFSRAEAELALEAQGRHANAAKASISGAEASVRYPRQPASSPWSSDISGVEPPLGVDLSYVEPCGTPQEVEESLRVAASFVSPGDAALAAPEDGHLASVRAAPDCATPLGSQSGVPSLIRGRRL
jgi:hypothetical protein